MFRTRKQKIVEVVVRSKRVLSHVENFSYYNPVSLTTGAHATPARAVVYKREFDESQQNLLKSAREFADAQGFGFHVRDISGDNMIHRALRRITTHGKFVPRIMIHGPHEVVSVGPSALKLGSLDGKGVSLDGR